MERFDLDHFLLARFFPAVNYYRIYIVITSAVKRATLNDNKLNNHEVV
jgi:hypothetical protein